MKLQYGNRPAVYKRTRIKMTMMDGDDVGGDNEISDKRSDSRS